MIFIIDFVLRIEYFRYQIPRINPLSPQWNKKVSLFYWLYLPPVLFIQNLFLYVWRVLLFIPYSTFIITLIKIFTPFTPEIESWPEWNSFRVCFILFILYPDATGTSVRSSSIVMLLFMWLPFIYPCWNIVHEHWYGSQRCHSQTLLLKFFSWGGRETHDFASILPQQAITVAQCSNCYS